MPAQSEKPTEDHSDSQHRDFENNTEIRQLLSQLLASLRRMGDISDGYFAAQDSDQPPRTGEKPDSNLVDR